MLINECILLWSFAYDLQHYIDDERWDEVQKQSVEFVQPSVLSHYERHVPHCLRKWVIQAQFR